MDGIKVFFDPLPVEGSNILRVQSKEYYDNISIKFFGYDPIPFTSSINIEEFYTTVGPVIPFTLITPTKTGNFILYKTESADLRKEAFEHLFNVIKSNDYDPNMLLLLIENFIYHAKNLKYNEDFFSSSGKLRDDELLCLKQRVEKSDGLTWICNLCKSANNKSPLNLFWNSENRVLHFVDGVYAKEMFSKEEIPVGSSVIRVSMNNPAHVAITYKTDPNIKHGIFEYPEKALQLIEGDSKIKYVVIAAPLPKLGNINYLPKSDLFTKEAKYTEVFVGGNVNQMGSSKCEQKILTQQEELEEIKRKTVNPEFCKSFGPNLLCGLTHHDNTFTIQAVNSLNEDMRIGGCKFDIFIIGSTSSCEYFDHDDGSYTVSYKVEEPGFYKISIGLIDHQGTFKHIMNSPFDVSVVLGENADYHQNIAVNSEKDFMELISQQKAVYGDIDARVEAEDCDDEFVKHNIECTLSIWVREDISPRGNSFSELKIRQFGRAYQLHPDEPFYHEPIGATGTAFLVTDRIICTAGHCVSDKDGLPLERLRFVTGYKENNSETSVYIPNDRIYYGVKIIFQKNIKGVHDFTLIELDRPVKNVYNPTARVSISRRIKDNKKINEGTELYIIGHPCGLPLKVARHTKSVVTDVGDTTFRARLDAFAGNSGSPVFNGHTHQIEGILIGGNADFISFNGKYRSTIIPKGSSKNLGETCYDFSYVYKVLQYTPLYQDYIASNTDDSLPKYQPPVYPCYKF